MDFNIKDYGAVTDGEQINTNAIQSAIDACADNGAAGLLFLTVYIFPEVLL